MSFFRANLIGLKADRDKKEIGMSRVDTSARLMVHTKYQLNLAPKFSSVLNLIIFKKCIDFSVHFSPMSTWCKHRRNHTIN